MTVRKCFHLVSFCKIRSKLMELNKLRQQNPSSVVELSPIGSWEGGGGLENVAWITIVLLVSHLAQFST